jgi:hypothetical protein
MEQVTSPDVPFRVSITIFTQCWNNAVSQWGISWLNDLCIGAVQRSAQVPVFIVRMWSVQAADCTICVLALYSGLPKYQLLSLECETYRRMTGRLQGYDISISSSLFTFYVQTTWSRAASVTHRTVCEVCQNSIDILILFCFPWYINQLRNVNF